MRNSFLDFVIWYIFKKYFVFGNIWLVLYCDICIVSLKYFFTYGTLNLTFLHYMKYGLHYLMYR